MKPQLLFITGNATTSDVQKKNNIPSSSEKRATIGNKMNPIRLQRTIALPKPGGK